jgi:hypothetical protein
MPRFLDDIRPLPFFDQIKLIIRWRLQSLATRARHVEQHSLTISLAVHCRLRAGETPRSFHYPLGEKKEKANSSANACR